MTCLSKANNQMVRYTLLNRQVFIHKTGKIKESKKSPFFRLQDFEKLLSVVLFYYAIAIALLS